MLIREHANLHDHTIIILDKFTYIQKDIKGLPFSLPGFLSPRLNVELKPGLRFGLKTSRLTLGALRIIYSAFFISMLEILQ